MSKQAIKQAKKPAPPVMPKKVEHSKAVSSPKTPAVIAASPEIVIVRVKYPNAYEKRATFFEGRKQRRKWGKPQVDPFRRKHQQLTAAVKQAEGKEKEAAEENLRLFIKMLPFPVSKI